MQIQCVLVDLMQDIDFREKQITNLLQLYKKDPTKRKKTNLKKQLADHQVFLNNNVAAPKFYQFLNATFAQLDKFNNQISKANAIKQLGDNAPPQNKVGNASNKLEITDVQLLSKDVRERLMECDKNLEKALDTSTYIKLKLKQQIDELDEVYIINRDTKVRLRRVKKGLTKILQRAMTAKLTRFLAILAVLAVLGIIVFYILKGQGVISVQGQQ